MKIRAFSFVSAAVVSLSLVTSSAEAFPIPGSYAPLFEAPAVIPQPGSAAGKLVEKFNLSSLIGKSRIMLLTYPKNCTFICPTELIALKKRIEDFHDLGYEVLVLSTDEASLDNDKEASHQAWRMKSDKPAEGRKDTPIGIGDADFIMVSDKDRKIIQDYGVEGPDGLALRATFFIDKQGKVQIAEVQMNSIGRDVDELYRKAAALKFVEDNESMLAPQGWKPGDPGMETSHSSVRKQVRKQQ
ncbi:redoxin domain-containing protein [Endozoicomonas montiporae]|uniref:Thioredoxin peroxidase n=1 Tax=Endozoicomonas montiporae CL-33 TaxID=570277 RepID=A0A142B8G5_9GAMM|nr:redoxin domain-containing protein [Endozoicomonas montiporae]AMO55041.1 alkyl hydroperoxide reductase [Endozoicomonas montiporae CL-33]